MKSQRKWRLKLWKVSLSLWGYEIHGYQKLFLKTDKLT